jgi:dTDP-4-amino-4,6-dideoxygalactose transaminase
MITTQREVVDRQARSLRDHGASISDLARHTNKAGFLLAAYNHLGYNYRLTDIQGALGCTQMDKAAWILEERMRRAHFYDEILSNVPWLVLPSASDESRHGYQSYVCLFCPKEPTFDYVDSLHKQRNALMTRLEANGIATRQGTHAPVILGYYAEKYGLRPEQFPNAYYADRLSLALPLYAQMTQAEQEFVVNQLQEMFSKCTSDI